MAQLKHPVQPASPPAQAAATPAAEPAIQPDPAAELPGCPSCGSIKLAEGIELVVAHAGPATAYLEGQRVVVKARICADCGATALVAEEPQRIYEAYAKSQA